MKQVFTQKLKGRRFTWNRFPIKICQ